jgi:hypothetical protein
MKPQKLLHLIKDVEQTGFNTTFSFDRIKQQLTLTIIKKRRVEAVMP